MFDETNPLDEFRSAGDATMGTVEDEAAATSSGGAAVLEAEDAAAGAGEAAGVLEASATTLGATLLCEDDVGRGWSCDRSVGLCGGSNIAPCAVSIGALLGVLSLLSSISRPFLTVRA
jgi:hypothetical protein